MQRLFILVLCLFLSPANACTDFKITAKDGTVLIARSMEFAMDLKSNLRSSPRGRTYASLTPNGKHGLTWKATYGYLYVDGLDQNFTVDGMNENGLSFEYLYLPGDTQYPTIPAGKENEAVPYFYFGDWVLSNFKTVDEVRHALKTIHIFAQTIPNLGEMIFPLHAAIYDANGKGIIVEFVQGRMNVYGSLGILTNSPSYKWHLSNLKNYLNLSSYNPKPIAVNGMTFSATGQGAGMVGLPGDVSPPSRFVKTAFMLNAVYPANNAYEALNIAQHILNNVDIPTGLARTVDDGKESSDMTEWAVFKDLTHKIFYYRTYNDMTIRYVSMDKIDFSENAPQLKMPLSEPPFTMDLTSKLIQRKER